MYDDENDISATMNILIRKVPIFGNLMYVPRGPIGQIEDEDILRKITKKIKELAKQYKAFVIIMEPNIKKENEKFEQLVKKLGYKVNSKAYKFEQEIQARHNFILNLENKTEDDIFMAFSSKTRYNIRLAIKRGVRIEEKNESGIDEFYKLMQETGKRDNFLIRPKEYFLKILKEFPNEAKIYIAYYNDTPLATIMPIHYGNKMWYLYGASGNEYRNLMPTYLLQWEMIQQAIGKNCVEYNFRGVCIDKGTENGLYRFKKGFGGDFVELIGEIYIPFKPLKYAIFKIAKRVFCHFRWMINKNKDE